MTKKVSPPDHHTKNGRKVIDEQVLALLSQDGQSRSVLASTLKLQDNVLSASLRRLEVAGKARRDGTTSKTKWFRTS